jgi:3-hydroxyacyl-CoA dehydrogenase
MKSLQTIGVIGAGTMGTGIAQVCALTSSISVAKLAAATDRAPHYVVERLRTSFSDVPRGWPPA